MSTVLSPNKRSRKHSHQEFLSLMIAAKRLPSSSYQQITDLNLSNLQLIKIDTFPFKYLPNLVSLDFSYNQLVSIENDWSRDQPNMIEKCNFSHNKLETFLFLKDFHHLKWLNLTENLLRTANERFLILHLCSKLENLIDANQEQIDDDQLKLDQWLQLMETKIDRLWTMSYYEKYQQETVNEKKNSIGKKILDEFRHAIIKIIEKQQHFSQIHLSPLANYLFDKKIEELCSSIPSTSKPTKRTLRTHLTSDFNQLFETKNNFELFKYIRCHQNSEQDLINVPVRMCHFEPNASNPLLATCGGQKVCFIDCQTGEVTHIYEVASLRSTTMPTTVGRKFKDKQVINVHKEYFSCLRWIEIPNSQENLHVLAVGASNGHIYLLSAKWKIMFGHIELANSSINCLTWHSNDPSTLVIGSHKTIRLIDIQSYFDRFRSFINKQSQPVQCISSSLFETKILIKQCYQFDHDVTNILIYPWKNNRDRSIVLVGTTSGLFAIRDETLVKLIFPKSMCTVGEHIESICPIDYQTDLMAMTILGLDQVCCFDLEQTLTNNQLYVSLTFASPSRQLSCQMAIESKTDENGISLECILPTDHGSFLFHQIRIDSNTRKTKKIAFDHKRSEISWSPDKASSSSASLLSTCLNEQYLCLTSNNNLICIYQRK